MQNGFPAANDQRVSRVVSALKTGDNIRLLGVKVNDFPLAFITPLSAYYRNIGHEYILSYIFMGVTETTCGNFRNLSRMSDARGESVFRTTSAFFVRASRLRCRRAILTLLSPSVVPRLPITPGRSSLETASI